MERTTKLPNLSLNEQEKVKLAPAMENKKLLLYGSKSHNFAKSRILPLCSN
jgi:hypothetical protein